MIKIAADCMGSGIFRGLGQTRPCRSLDALESGLSFRLEEKVRFGLCGSVGWHGMARRNQWAGTCRRALLPGCNIGVGPGRGRSGRSGRSGIALHCETSSVTEDSRVDHTARMTRPACEAKAKVLVGLNQR
jgi:hypothetical protein